MPNFNKVILAGNLTRDPELRHLPKGTAVTRFGLAINRKWKDDGGTEHEEVMFIDVDAMGRQAEVIAQYLRKGRPLLVEGRLKLNQWDDKKTGEKRQQILVHLESFTFLDSGGGKTAGSAAPARPAPAAAPNGTDGKNGTNGAAEDDVPF